MVAIVTERDVEITIECHEEDESPAGFFDSGDPEADQETVDEILASLRRGNEWSWCVVRVVARWQGFEGSSVLGACSYASERDFKRGGYYEDMVSEAIADLNQSIGRAAS